MQQAPFFKTNLNDYGVIIMEDMKKNDNAAKPQSALKKAWGIFTTLITIMLVVVAIYCVVGVANQANTGELFFPFGYRPVKILTGSMEDTLQTGAIVVVEQTDEVEEEDIVFFISKDGAPVIHRYVDTDENGNMITKGDANPKEDFEPVTAEQLLGKVVVVMNWLSWLG